MKPYIAILYDSLIESIQSRVLWILLAAWTLILVALFPLSLSEGESYRVRMGEITNAKTVLDQLAAASSGKGTRSQKLVYAAIDQEFQNSLRDRQKTGRRISVGRLVTALNTVMDKPDLYDRDAWPTAERDSRNLRQQTFLTNCKNSIAGCSISRSLVRCGPRAVKPLGSRMRG